MAPGRPLIGLRRTPQAPSVVRVRDALLAIYIFDLADRRLRSQRWRAISETCVVEASILASMAFQRPRTLERDRATSDVKAMRRRRLRVPRCHRRASTRSPGRQRTKEGTPNDARACRSSGRRRLSAASRRAPRAPSCSPARARCRPSRRQYNPAPTTRAEEGISSKRKKPSDEMQCSTPSKSAGIVGLPPTAIRTWSPCTSEPATSTSLGPLNEAGPLELGNTAPFHVPSIDAVQSRDIIVSRGLELVPI